MKRKTVYIILSIIALLILGGILFFNYKNMKNDYQNKAQENLKEASLQARELFTLADGEYFKFDDGQISELESKLLDIDFIGVVLGSPKKIDIKQEDKLPLLIGIRFSGARDWDHPVRENTYLVATDLSNGKIYKKQLFHENDGRRVQVEEKEKGFKPTSGLATASSSVTSVNVRDIIPKFSWAKGEWSFSVSYYDWTSNIVNVLLE